jgi:hypothetical protein
MKIKENLRSTLRNLVSTAVTLAMFLGFMLVARTIYEPLPLECTCVCEASQPYEQRFVVSSSQPTEPTTSQPTEQD